jgi:hypothetical protein
MGTTRRSELVGRGLLLGAGPLPQSRAASPARVRDSAGVRSTTLPLPGGTPPINENARDFRPWRFPDVSAAYWIIIARQPWVGLRVSPLPAPSYAAAGARASSFLASRVLRLSSPRVFRSPQIPALMIASRCVLGLPRFPHLPASPTVNLRVAPDLRSVCAAFRPISRFPRLLCLLAVPAG